MQRAALKARNANGAQPELRSMKANGSQQQMQAEHLHRYLIDVLSNDCWIMGSMNQLSDPRSGDGLCELLSAERVA